MLLSGFSVEGDDQVGGPRRDVAAVVFPVEVDKVDAAVGKRPSLVERGRAGDDVKDSAAGVHQRVGRFEAAASRRDIGRIVGDLLGGAGVDNVDAVKLLGRFDAGDLMSGIRGAQGSRPKP